MDFRKFEEQNILNNTPGLARLLHQAINVNTTNILNI